MNRRGFLKALAAGAAALAVPAIAFGKASRNALFQRDPKHQPVVRYFDMSPGTVFQDVEGGIPAKPGDRVARIDSTDGLFAWRTEGDWRYRRRPDGRHYVECEEGGVWRGF